MDVVELLSNHKANVNMECGISNTVFQRASAAGSEDIVKLMLSNKPGRYGAEVAVVKLLLENEADPDVTGKKSGPGLWQASREGFVEISEITA